MAPVINEKATVMINGLKCGVTYTITAGGTLNGYLVGPRSSHGNIVAGPCPVTSSTVSPSASSSALSPSLPLSCKSKAYYHGCVYIRRYIHNIGEGNVDIMHS